MKKKTKRILAVIGVVLLVGLYLATLIFALIDSPWAFDLFKVCVGFTIVLPVLLYIYTFVFRQQKKHGEAHDDHDNDL